VAALEERGALDSTLVVLTSDGGFLWGEHGMYRKRSAYEPSIRVPLIARWPAAIPAGTRVDALALNVDLAPTFLSLAGAQVPPDLPGASLERVWSGDHPADWRADFLYLDAWSGPEGPLELAVVGERTKYVRFRAGAVEELLLDRVADPDERIDLACDPGHATELARMRARMATLLAEVEAPAAWMDAAPDAEPDGEDDD
jgi:N-acetylglucosamine-6-sulfatase